MNKLKEKKYNKPKVNNIFNQNKENVNKVLTKAFLDFLKRKIK